MNSIIRKGMLPVAVAIAMLGVIGAFGGNTRSAEAIQGDICAAYVGDEDGAIEVTEDFDGQGNDVYVIERGVTYGLNFRVQDIITAWLLHLREWSEPDPAEDVDPPYEALVLLEELVLAGVLPGPNVHVEVDSETGSARITSQAQAFSFSDRDDVTIGTFTVGELWLVPNVTHVLINPGVISQVTQTYNPRFFNNSSGFPIDSINDWLQNPAGMSAFASDDLSVCGAASGGLNQIIDTSVDPADCSDFGDCTETDVYTAFAGDDSWGYVDFECIESGYFHIDLRTSDIQWGVINDLLLPLIDEAFDENDITEITPQEALEMLFYWNLDPARSGLSLKFFCGGQADTAEIASQRATVETQPTNVGPSGFGTSVITVTVMDQDGDRIDGAEVHFTTDNCQLRDTDPVGDNPISPAGGGTSVTTFSDTDTSSDTNFVANNPLQHSAGTAEVLLNCTLPGSTAGVANITAIVDRPGSDIVLKTTVNVIGPVAPNGLTLTLTPDDIECGETILATATAVDAQGNPVSDGTVIYFTTDTSSGVIGGVEGAQGSEATVDGEASVLIATDPGNPGTHTVIAYTINAGGTPNAQVSETYVCEGDVAPSAPVPTVGPPGTGTGSITPPNTGDAGLATSSGSMSLFVIAGAVAFLLAGVASIRFARN